MIKKVKFNIIILNIFRFVNEINKAFCVPMAIQFIASGLIIALTTFKLSTDTSVSMITLFTTTEYLVGMLFQLCLYCVLGDFLKENVK